MIAAITGANGFIGQHLVRRFAEAGWETRPILRRDFESGAMESLARGANVVVHAAGATRATTVERLRASNVALTARVLDAARLGGASRFVFISSLAAGGPAPSLDAPVTEAAAAPVEPYGRSKLDAESIVRGQSAIRSVIVRPPAVYGPGDRDFLAMFRLARLGVAAHPANRSHWLNLVHVADLADGVLRCASDPAPRGDVYILGNDAPVQWRDLFRLSAECAGRRLRVDVNVPVALVAMGAMLGDFAARLTGRASLLTSAKLALSRPAHWLCSSERAKRDLSFVARIDLADGLRETYRWYVANGWLS